MTQARKASEIARSSEFKGDSKSESKVILTPEQCQAVMNILKCVSVHGVKCEAPNLLRCTSEKSTQILNRLGNALKPVPVNQGIWGIAIFIFTASFTFTTSNQIFEIISLKDFCNRLLILKLQENSSLKDTTLDYIQIMMPKLAASLKRIEFDKAQILKQSVTALINWQDDADGLGKIMKLIDKAGIDFSAKEFDALKVLFSIYLGRNKIYEGNGEGFAKLQLVTSNEMRFSFVKKEPDHSRFRDFFHVSPLLQHPEVKEMVASCLCEEESITPTNVPLFFMDIANFFHKKISSNEEQKDLPDLSMIHKNLSLFKPRMRDVDLVYQGESSVMNALLIREISSLSPSIVRIITSYYGLIFEDICKDIEAIISSRSSQLSLQ